MSIASLNFVRQKILWSAQHLKSLEAESILYFKDEPGEVVAEEEPQSGRIICRFNARIPIPDHIPLIIGDALQNLRSSLDYLVWELILAANNEPQNSNLFPVCETPKVFAEELRRNRLLGVPTDAITEIERLQPYHAGDKWESACLWVLHYFCNINKHRRVLLTTLAVHASHAEWSSTESHSVQSTLTPRYHGAEVSSSPAPSKAGEIMEVKGKIVTFITFNERPAEGIQISVCLNQLWGFVDRFLVPKFERFFK